MTRLRHLGTELRKQLRIHPLIALVLTALMRVQDGEFRPTQIVLTFGINFTISLCIGGVAASLYILLLDRFSLPRKWWAWAVHLGVIFSAIVMGVEIALRFLSLFLDMGDDMAQTRMGVWQTGGVVTVVVIAMGATYEKLRERARTVELREQQARQELLEARMENLQARINPHFLFNSLNTVAALIDEDRDRAVRAVERLSELLRYGLEGTTAPSVPLEREVAAVRDYLEMEALRFGARLRHEIHVEPEAQSVEVPPLLLQPLAENAVKHGVSARRAGATIRVVGRFEDDQLILSVHDDGPGISHAPGTKTGEDNIRQRLALAYGGAATLETGPDESGGYRACITIPLEVP